MRLRHLTPLFAPVVAVTLLASPAAAEDIHFTEPEFCQYSDDGSRTCSSSEGIYHIALTAKGYAVIGKGTTHYSAITPTSSIEETVDYKVNWLVKDNSDQVLTIRRVESNVVDGQSCSTNIDFHFANGRILFTRVNRMCA